MQEHDSARCAQSHSVNMINLQGIKASQHTEMIKHFWNFIILREDRKPVGLCWFSNSSYKPLCNQMTVFHIQVHLSILEYHKKTIYLSNSIQKVKLQY